MSKAKAARTVRKLPRDFIPLSIPVFQGNEAKYLQDCIASGWVSSVGPWVNRFENEFAQYLGCKGAVSVTSGTAALHLALIIAGVEAGDEVIVPTLTFVAPVNTIRYVNAHPVFMDCDVHLNLDVPKVRKFLESECEFDGKRTINKKTRRPVKAVIPVHVFGHPIDMQSLMELTDQYRLKVIEDATESLGSRFPGPNGTFGAFTGTVGHIGCFSFNGNKIMTTGGGGMLVSNYPEVLAKAKYLSTQAKDDELFFVHHEVGFNYRLTSIQAAVGIAQLEQMKAFVEKKRENFTIYQDLVVRRGIGRMLEEPKGTRSNYWLYALVIDERFRFDMRGLIEKLQADGIQARPVWKLNHDQKPFASCKAYEIEQAPRLLARVLSVPSTVTLTQEEIQYVVESIEGALTQS